MDETSVSVLQNEIAELERILTDKKRQLEEALNVIPKAAVLDKPDEIQPNAPAISEINNYSSPETKIALFRSLFRGREDVALASQGMQNVLKAGKPASLVISLPAAVNGFGESVKNPK
jgi:hypothetical protein